MAGENASIDHSSDAYRINRRRPSFLHFHQGEQGALLLTLIIVVTVLAIVGTAIVHFSTTGTYTEVLANRHRAAYYAAESGGRYAIPQIRADFDTAVAELNGRTFPFGDNSAFTLTIDEVTDPCAVLLTSQGVVNAGQWSEARADLTYRIPRVIGESNIPFAYALFGVNAVSLTAAARIGEFGVYPDFSERVLVGTNAATITIGSFAKVYGNTVTNANQPFVPAVPPLPAVYDTPMLLQLAKKNLEYLGTDDLDFAPWNNFGDGHATINAGSYQLNSFSMHNFCTLNLNGDITLVVAGLFTAYASTTVNVNGNVVISANDIDIHHATRFILAPGATLTFFFNNNFKFHEGSKINPCGGSANVQINGTDTALQVILYQFAQLNGVIYAPTATADIYMQSTINGALYVSNATVRMASTILYGGPSPDDPPVQYFSQ